MSDREKRFGLLRSIFWPIHRSEVKKVLSMLFLLFLLCVCYSVLRNLKDTLILTAKHSGAEVIPFIKVWGILPASFLGAWVFTRLRRFFSKEKVFYILLSSFVAYFLLFAFVIYPHSEQLHLERLGEQLSSILPRGFQGFIALLRNWTFTTFYVIAELWSVLVLFLLYWGFANDVTGVGEAKRTYGILNIGSNIAPVIGGSLALTVAHMVRLPLFGGSDAWRQTITALILLICILTVAAMFLYHWINRHALPREVQILQEEEQPKEQKRLSIRESIRYIAQNKYLIALSIIVLGYNISINLTDVLWKEQLKRFFVDPNLMLEHMNMITIGIGLFATVGALLFSFMVTRLGWTFIAMLTPFIMTTMAMGFFTFLFCGDFLMAFSASLFQTTPLAMTVYFGSMQNCLSKASKYSVFDASKELAYLPLSPESKLKGKAAIDGLGSGLGKSGSSLVYQSLIIFFGSVALSTPYIAALLFIVFIAWIFSVAALGKQFNFLTKKTSVDTATPQDLTIP